MSFIGFIIIGFFAGLVARIIKPGNDDMGLVMTTLIGVGGASLGAYIMDVLGYRFLSPWLTIAVSLALSVVLLYGADLFRTKRIGV